KAQSVPEIIAAAPHSIAHLDQVVAPLFERVRQTRVSLQSRRIIVVAAGKLAAAVRIKQRNLWIEGTAKSPAEHFKTDSLPGLDAEPVVVGNLCIHLADDDTGNRHALRRGWRP